MYQVNLDEAVDKYGDMVYRLAVIKTGQEADAQDVFGEVFLKLVRYHHKIQSEEHLKAWLLRVTIHCAIKQQTSLWKKRTSFLEDTAKEMAGSSGVFSMEESPVAAAVMSLPSKYRDVIHLHYFEGYSVEEMAGILQKKTGTIKSLLSRGRQQLRKKLGEGFK
ncbi:MAG: RNA polymerase sigma factor [Lachnospiraceae bacterium]|nr:RNA polymerase sigma factor [Lachnospiraceae bacterium]